VLPGASAAACGAAVDDLKGIFLSPAWSRSMLCGKEKIEGQASGRLALTIPSSFLGPQWRAGSTDVQRQAAKRVSMGRWSVVTTRTGFA
jgi:hypothetical protein